jgi:hypothetical protein
LDGANPREDSESTAFELDAEAAISYAVRMIFKAGAILSKSSVSQRIWRDCIDPISGYVLSRMFLDWKDRYNEGMLLENPQIGIEFYESNVNTRLQASGYWEVMIRAAYTVHSQDKFPTPLIKYCNGIRKFRQLIDELQDIGEDTKAGLLTLPVLFMMEDNETNTRQLVKDIWDIERNKNNIPPEKCRSGQLIAKLKQRFVESEAKNRYFMKIDKECSNLVNICEQMQTVNLRNIVDFKTAKYITLKEQYV